MTNNIPVLFLLRPLLFAVCQLGCGGVWSHSEIALVSVSLRATSQAQYTWTKQFT